MDSAIEHHTGTLILGDVIGFSLLCRDDQLLIVENIWEFVDQAHFLKGATVFFNGTGDGILIGIANYDATFDKTITFAKGWIQHMLDDSEPACNLRVAIHRGDFTTQPVSACGQGSLQMVGSACNEVARLVDYAGEGCVVVSEEAYKTWRLHEGEEFTAEVYPDPDEDPIRIYAKHNVPFDFRLYGALTENPSRVKLFGLVEEYLYGHLGEIEKTLIELVHEYDKTLGYEQLKPRVTIFSPHATANPTKLACTPYRYQRESIKETKSNTTYSFRNENGRTIEKPIGEAFVEYKSNFMGFSADPDSEEKAYLNEVAKYTGIAVSRIKKFGRKPRAIMAIPFGIYDKDDADPDGVVCIDLENNLESLSEQDIQSTMEYIATTFDEVLSYLWHIRT